MILLATTALVDKVGSRGGAHVQYSERRDDFHLSVSCKVGRFQNFVISPVSAVFLPHGNLKRCANCWTSNVILLTNSEKRFVCARPSGVFAHKAPIR